MMRKVYVHARCELMPGDPAPDYRSLFSVMEARRMGRLLKRAVWTSAEALKAAGIVVPEAFYKVVLRLSPQPAAIGFIYKNEDGNRPMGDYINTVRQVERITGIDFFPQLPDELEKRVEKQASLDDWR